MKMSLQQLFDLPFEEVRTNFNVTQPFEWAVKRLQDRLAILMSKEDWASLDNADERMYLVKSIKHFQSNLDELYHKVNTGIREIKPESHYKG